MTTKWETCVPGVLFTFDKEIQLLNSVRLVISVRENIVVYINARTGSKHCIGKNGWCEYAHVI